MCSSLFLSVIFTIVLWVQVGAKNYRWTAAVERSSGIATSLEVSSAPKPLTNACDTFVNYPHWLARPTVTFGILKAKPNPNGSTTIQLRGSGLDILTFARHVSKGRNKILLPITGGLLAHPNPRKPREYGALSFAMKTNQILETRIEGGYRPTISGYPPVSRARAWTYRSTQSLFHAYVMWRFHNYCHAAAACPTVSVSSQN